MGATPFCRGPQFWAADFHGSWVPEVAQPATRCVGVKCASPAVSPTPAITPGQNVGLTRER
ncbi:hypothetical protein SEA_OPIE_31 [Gordonia phage Opie]|nr:hypothetical protein SEA_OPIE_31 [Gordonia phage Opie]